MHTDIFSNSKASTPILLQACSIVVVLAYAWLTARSLEPKFPSPPALVREIGWIAKGQAINTREMRADKFLEVSRVEPAMLEAERTMSTVGNLREPVLLIIDADHPERYSVTFERIEIGMDLAGKPGVLERAFLKVWLYQSGDPAIVSSLFRLNVVADALAIIAGGDETLPAHPWLESAASHVNSCKASWQPPELAGICGESAEISQFSFRPLVASLIARAQEGLPFRERLRFLESWARRLTMHESEIAGITLPDSLEGWKLWLRSEVASLVPEDKALPSLQKQIEVELARVQLDKNSQITLDFSFHRDRRGPLTIERRPNDHRSLLVMNGDGSAELFPGGAQVSAADLKSIRTQTFVWESCESPTLASLLATSMQSSKLMFIQTCEQSGRGWAALLRGGLLQFAREQPKLAFLQLRRDQIDLAEARGQMSGSDSLTKYMGRKSQPSLLGLSTAEWRRDFQAYRPIGAIEAIEWFREPTAAL